MNQLVATELRLTIQERVEKALLLISEVMPQCGKLSDEVYAKLMEARDNLHVASVLCNMQNPPTTVEDEDKAA